MTSFSMVSCATDDDSTAIRELIKQGKSLSEKQDLRGLMQLTTDEFLALPGDLNRRETKRILWMAFRYYQSFKVVYPRPDVQLAKDSVTASAIFPFLIVKEEHSFPKLEELYENPKGWLEAVGESADLYRLKLELIKEGGDWLVRKALLEKFTRVSFRS